MRIECRENQAAIWVIESPRVRRKIIGELLEQFHGKAGQFVLSDQEKELDIGKSAEIIEDPFDVDVNDKKFIAKVYSELKDIAFGDVYYPQTQQLITHITSYLMEIEQEASVYLDYGEMDFSQMLKAWGIRIDDCENEIVGKLGQYLHILSRLMKKKIVVFCNLSLYLETWEIEKILQEAYYQKLYVILLESQEMDIAIKRKYYIIDKDNCEIY